jgi:hypothetical protein
MSKDVLYVNALIYIYNKVDRPTNFKDEFKIEDAEGDFIMMIDASESEFLYGTS